MSEPKRRIGRFKATREALMSNGPECHLIFSQVTPLAIEWNWDSIATITGLSDLFEELEAYIEPLDYEIIIQRDGDQTKVVVCRAPS